MTDESKKIPQTDDLRKTEYGKTWSVSDDSSISQALSEILRAALQDETMTEDQGVLFYIANQPKPIVIAGESVIRIGRGDGNFDPDLDLNAYHGLQLGVSRNHAEIVFSNGGYYIKDMGSTNGTFINGKKVQPYRQTVLQDSDQIRLGHFTMLIKFAT